MNTIFFSSNFFENIAKIASFLNCQQNCLSLFDQNSVLCEERSDLKANTIQTANELVVTGKLTMKFFIF